MADKRQSVRVEGNTPDQRESFLCMKPRCPRAVRITGDTANGRPQRFCGSKRWRADDCERAQLALDKERHLLHDTYSAATTREGDG